MKSQFESKNRWGFSGAILFPIISGFLAAALCVALYWREASQIETTTREREAARLNLFDQILRRNFKETTADLRVLADGDGLLAFLSTGEQSDLDRAIHRAEFFSREQPGYDPVHYLDEHGQEILCVNEGGNIVPRGQLKNKGDLPCFQRANTLKPGEIFISTFDLKTENGRVEQPLKPTLQFATPVFDKSGQRRGIYVIDCKGSNMVAAIQQLIPEQFRHRFRLLNSQGFWIKSDNPDIEWGFVFPDRAGQTVARTDAALWSKISSQSDGQVRHHGGLFTWHRFSPGNAVDESQTHVIAADAFLVLASQISPPEWNHLFAALRESFLIIGALLLALFVWGGRFFLLNRRNMIELQKSRQKFEQLFESAREANQELESFSYSVSHDLRAPLRHIDGFVDRLGKNPAILADEKSKRYLGIISQSARHMGNLIDDLLVFSRMGRTEMRETKVDLARVVNDTIEGLAEETKNRSVIFNPHDLPTVHGDPVMLQQVFANLVGNAVKYTRTRERAETAAD